MADPAFDLSRFEVLSFDCYGTLIDWETGIVRSLRAVIGGTARVADDTLLEAFAELEATLEAGPWRPYRALLAEALAGVCRQFGGQPSDQKVTEFGGSVADWPPFADSAAALGRLRGRFELAVITNCDDDLFAASNATLGAPFGWVVTAEQARAYKPATAIFELALERINRLPDRILHVAQSLYHDHVPAQRLGLATAWMNRRHGRLGSGATPPAAATPHLVVPDMNALADLLLA